MGQMAPQASWPQDVPAESLEARSPQPAVFSQDSSARNPQPAVSSQSVWGPRWSHVFFFKLAHEFVNLANIDLQKATEGRAFVKQYFSFLTSFWTGRRFSAILLNQVFLWYVFYHVFRSAPYPADRRTETQLKASGLSLLASQFVWEF